MRYIKTYEQNNFNECFVEIHKDKNISIYEYVYDIHIIGRNYTGENISVNFKKNIDFIDIIPHKDTVFEFNKNIKILTIDEFFNENKKDCVDLYYRLIEMIDIYPENDKYLILLNSLNSIKGLSLLLSQNKYNL